GPASCGSVSSGSSRSRRRRRSSSNISSRSRGGVKAEQLEALLADVAAGRLAPAAALERLRHLPYEDLPFARIDHHRALRQGQPEVVFCEGKTLEQVVGICERLEAA